MDNITFLGYDLSALRTEVAKIDAISKLPYPTEMKTLRSFIGMANFLKDFVPNITEEIAPF